MTEQPFFSVVIPTYARPQQLAACLDALAAVDFARDRFEVVVSDDGSPESPEQRVAAMRDLLAVRLIRGAHSGPASARNRGAVNSRGRYLVFIDDDCLPTAGWLAALEQRFAELARYPLEQLDHEIEIPRNLFSGGRFLRDAALALP
ncbi:MAG: glycosyltransferase [Gemmatimonadaceae bacterium]|nr:glycosyltransferase [Gemmatimonadaceae bacterium]MDQ3518097.1 glycosyltransferase family 2 protein [Gemmatimonadota bacterium]